MKETSTIHCECCGADSPLYWVDNENNAFVDRTGEVLITAKGKSLRFYVKFCPHCGYSFASSKASQM